MLHSSFSLAIYLLQFSNHVLCGGGGEWYSDLQLDSLTKVIIRTPRLCVLADLPGSLEDQQDLVHPFHLGHPESDRKDYIEAYATLAF